MMNYEQKSQSSLDKEEVKEPKATYMVGIIS
jgi:hypothetical protein